MGVGGGEGKQATVYTLMVENNLQELVFSFNKWV